jgi:hypothetical protein
VYWILNLTAGLAAAITLLIPGAAAAKCELSVALYFLYLQFQRCCRFSTPPGYWVGVKHAVRLAPTGILPRGSLFCWASVCSLAGFQRDVAEAPLIFGATHTSCSIYGL